MITATLVILVLFWIGFWGVESCIWEKLKQMSNTQKDMQQQLRELKNLLECGVSNACVGCKCSENPPKDRE